MEYGTFVKVMGLVVVAGVAVAGTAACGDDGGGSSSSSSGTPTTSSGTPTTSTPSTSSGTPTSTPSTSSGGTGSMQIGAGGYVTAGAWGGYAWTATDGKTATTIAPADFKALSAGETKLCASGSVAPDPAYGGVAMLGINLAQPATGGDGSVGTWTPSGSGITYSVTLNKTSDIRIQLQATGGATDATKRWCATLTSPSGTLAWADFNTECWQGGAGTPYDGSTPLESAMVLIPGGKDAAVPYDFCLNSILPK